MSQTTPPGKNFPTSTRHTFFAARYHRNSRSKMEQDLMRPLRREMVGKAYGVVIEIGAGTGLNFEFYEPGQVEHVEATDLDSAMLDYAHKNRKSARVPVTITQAPAEMLPFADATFDCAVSTLVFCSVSDQVQGLAEIKRVLKPGGTLLMIEHVRSKRPLVAVLQDIVTPITKRILGNCHWNRDTVRNIIDSGFKMTELRNPKRTTLPIVLVEAKSI
jgi:ubiquinone/menaquinone biosynthesis C-methylase UbiE